jgi:hypothetical protein
MDRVHLDISPERENELLNEIIDTYSKEIAADTNLSPYHRELMNKYKFWDFYEHVDTKMPVRFVIVYEFDDIVTSFKLACYTVNRGKTSNTVSSKLDEVIYDPSSICRIEQWSPTQLNIIQSLVSPDMFLKRIAPLQFINDPNFCK